MKKKRKTRLTRAFWQEDAAERRALAEQIALRQQKLEQQREASEKR